MQQIIERLKINKSDLSSHHALVTRIAEIKNEISMTWEIYSNSFAWLFNFDISKSEKKHRQIIIIITMILQIPH